MRSNTQNDSRYLRIIDSVTQSINGLKTFTSGILKIVDSTANTYAAMTSRLMLGNSNQDDIAVIGYEDNNNEILSIRANGGTSQIRLITKNVEALRINSSGNVGIGTDSPSYKLDVSGTGRFTGNVTAPTFVGNASTASQVRGTVAGTGTLELVRGTMADNDHFRILIGGTASNAGYVEIATGDDSSEPIYVRQYNGQFTTLTRTAALLDGAGNTSFPGTVSANSFSGKATSAGNADTANGQKFNWTNSSNSPTYLWAANANGTAFLASRADMSVKYATSAGSASSSTTAAHLPTAYIGGVKSNPQTYFNNTVGLKVAMTGVAGS